MKVSPHPTTYIKVTYSEIHKEYIAKDLFGKWWKAEYGATIQEALENYIKVLKPKNYVWS